MCVSYFENKKRKRTLNVPCITFKNKMQKRSPNFLKSLRDFSLRFLILVVPIMFTYYTEYLSTITGHLLNYCLSSNLLWPSIIFHNRNHLPDERNTPYSNINIIHCFYAQCSNTLYHYYACSSLVLFRLLCYSGGFY